jgi:hypothetical protein
MKLVNRYIGVDTGYLGDFSYRSHADFYPEYCDLEIDPNEHEGTTRQRFIEIFTNLDSPSKAKMIKGALERFPLGDSDAPSTRTESLYRELFKCAEEYENLGAISTPTTKITSPVVELAIQNAEKLIKGSGAASGIDRIHTALHGYLIAACESEEIEYPKEATINKLLKLLRENHTKLADLGPRSQDIEQVLNSCSGILNALNPIRNQSSVAHPNKNLLRKEEALLVVNVTRTLLHYLDSKLS